MARNASCGSRRGGGSSSSNVLYDQLFTDENHFLFLFMEYGDTYISWYVCGSEAGRVIDDAAVDVFLNYVDEYYSSDMEDEEFFSAVFADTAERITAFKMKQYPLPPNSEIESSILRLYHIFSW